MSIFHVRFKSDASLEIESDIFAKFNDELMGFYVLTPTTQYMPRMFRAPAEIVRTEKRWTMVVPLDDLAFVCPAHCLKASADRNPEGQDAEERLGAEHESAVAEGQTPDPQSQE